MKSLSVEMKRMMMLIMLAMDVMMSATSIINIVTAKVWEVTMVWLILVLRLSSSPCVPEVSKPPVLQALANSTSSSSSMGCTTPIVCHRRKGMGHVMEDCPSQ
jgi:hypothetical protein